ncbi:TRAP transporter small permease subunit [Rubrimonas cliftonensis]|uniref:TRAP transporter small permease protein n=1 Tax=Rubrimonas cliftonensis TaxID=89524 RepID=A0A1H3YCV5_9RHOB|nr:TRAP transporter small permease [Rubrimonas cliftonensis]SEA08758.1 TRAP-type C4-dicarboxylate transport system, small permease component [Rubrimonas cliftonensis]
MTAQTETTRARHGGVAALRAIGWLSQACGLVASLMILASVLITCQMIFIRYVLGGSTIWQTEAVIYLMVGATMLGLPYVQYLRGHVNVDLVPLALPMAARRVLAAVVLCLSLAVLGVMFFHGFELWLMAWERGWRSETVWGVKLWIPYLALPVGFGLFILQLAADLAGVVLGVDRPFGVPDADAGEDA